MKSLGKWLVISWLAILLSNRYEAMAENIDSDKIDLTSTKREMSNEDIIQMLWSLQWQMDENANTTDALVNRISMIEQNIVTNDRACQSGHFVFNVWPGCIDGANPYNRTVEFEFPFNQPPAVVIGTTNIDSLHSANLRMDVKLECVSAQGFTVSFNTWVESILYGGGVHWMACPGPELEQEWLL